MLPDCGVAPATTDQAKGLGLACGGKYPVILFKTNTGGSKSSICGETSSGEKLRVVVTPAGSTEPLDLKGEYDYTIDSFVAKDGDTTYQVRGYDGTIVTKRDGKTSTETSDDWSSLDNESDFD